MNAGKESVALEDGLPDGYDVAGNFGNGKWYFTRNDHPQQYLGKGWDTRQEAIAAARASAHALARVQGGEK